MKVLGLDVSSSSTGFSICEDGYIDINSIGTIEPPKKLTMGAKLVYFEKELKKLLKKYQPDAVVLEDVFRGPNAVTFKILSMFRGVAMKTIQEKTHKDPMSIFPTEARKAVGVIGLKKEDAFKFITEKYNFKDFTFVKHNDICDSIVLALSYFYPRPEPKPKKKRKKSNAK